MVPRQRNIMIMQTLRRSHEHVLVLRRVLVSGQSQALLLRHLDARLQFFGGALRPLWWMQGRKGSVNPLALRRHGTITQHSM